MRYSAERMPASPPSEHLNAAEFVASADDVFGRIASRYDLLCDLFSFWIHRHWKRRVALLIASHPWEDLLDVASGTGDIVLRVLSRQPSAAARRIVASDISPQMLAIAKRRLDVLGQSVELRQLDAHDMPSVPGESVDLFSISFAMKICDRHAVLREALRVLKPDGRLIVLEASTIPVRWLRQAYLLYMSVCMPVIGGLPRAVTPPRIAICCRAFVSSLAQTCLPRRCARLDLSAFHSSGCRWVSLRSMLVIRRLPDAGSHESRPSLVGPIDRCWLRPELEHRHTVAECARFGCQCRGCGGCLLDQGGILLSRLIHG